MGRHFHLALILAVAALVAACGSSSTTLVSPSENRCAVTVAATTTTIGPTGGSGSVTVDTARECQWTATADAAWLTLSSGASGQGPNTISYLAAANATSASRRASITVNGQRVEIMQEAAACAASLPQRTFAVEASGGGARVPLTAQSLCTWTAVSRVSWIVVTSNANGSGDAEIVLSVAANTGAARSGVVDIAGQEVTVTQAAAPAGCSFAIDPASGVVGADTSQLTVAVTASPNCAWAAISENPWIAVTSGAAGVGNGSVVLQIAANSGAFRIGTVTIAGRAFGVTQSAAPAACSYAVAPASQSVPAAGGTTAATVSTSGACPWSTTGVPAWISVTGGSGSGNGTVNFTVQANTGAARAAAMTIAGQSFTINQAAAASSCTFSLNPTSHSPAAAGGATSVAVTTAAGCSWSTTGLPSWITFTSGNGTGSGNGTVNLTIAANTGTARTATLTIAGQPFPVNQAAGTPACTYALNPTTFSAPVAGGPTSVAVTTTSSCSWTTTGVPAWITVLNNSGGGTGNGTVSLQIAANTGAARSETLTIAGQSYTVNQAAPCAYTLNPTSYSVSALGGSTSVAVSTTSGCNWSTTGLPSWINFSNGNGTGNGSGSVSITVQANTGAARTADLTIAGQQFTVSQAAAIPCTYTVSPRVFDLDKNSHTGAGAVSISVQTTSLCAWTATITNGNSWLTIRTGSSGLGNGSTTVDVSANNGSARTGTLTVAGQTVTINQEKN